MTSISPEDSRRYSLRRPFSLAVFLAILFVIQGCGEAVTLEFDTECINLERISDIDPPGVGGYDDVFVTTGLDNPSLCGNVELGDLEIGDLDIDTLDPLGDVRRRYTMQGPSNGADEAFFETSLPVPENRIHLPLIGLEPSDGVWQFEAPGVRLPIENLRGDVVMFRKGDRVEGHTTQVQFSLLLDSRVKIVKVAFWRLVRESDGDGPTVNRQVMASWFGDQNVRELWRKEGGRVGAQYWGVGLEDYPDPSQVVDPVFAQCEIDDRVQFRLVSYMDVTVDDRLVDYFDKGGRKNECGHKWTHVLELRNMGFWNEDAINLIVR